MIEYGKQKECINFLLSLQLINCKNDKEYLKKIYCISNNISNNYRKYIIKKRNGKVRVIYEPSKTLKCIQKNILKKILNNKEISKHAKAYHKNIKLIDNAIEHVNKKIILKLDIVDFFNNIRFIDVYNSCFSEFPKQVGMLLTYLCTYNDYLLQGAPTSSYISNLVMREFDKELGSWCIDNNISYTRYSDDMTFSGDFIPSIVISKVRKMLYKTGLKINNDKIHVITNSSCQLVTGLVVNKKVQTSLKYRNKIRQEIYYINKYGLNSHLQYKNKNIDKNKYLDVLYGKILFVLQVNPYDKEFNEYKKIVKNIRRKYVL